MASHPKLRKILYCTDFSKNAERAFDIACGLAEGEETTLYLMFVIPHTPIWARVEASELLANNVTQKMKEAEQLLKTQYEDRCDKDIQTRKIVREGREYQEIIAFAKDEKVDLIIVGTHGQTGLGHVLLGSVAEKVVRNSKVPVLVVPS